MNVASVIKRRLAEFRELGKKGRATFDFSPFLDLRIKATLKTELIFCICTANSSAISGLKVQKELEGRNPEALDANAFKELLRRNGVRFYSRKAKYAVRALRDFGIVREALRMNDSQARELLAKEIKGLGYKEASHFLRNIGRENLAILDRHILGWLRERGIINEISNLSRRRYLEIEELLRKMAAKHRMSLAEFDLWIWYRCTGKVLK